MKTADRYLKYVRWGSQDSKYVGYCPDLFRGEEYATAIRKKKHTVNCADWWTKKLPI